MQARTQIDQPIMPNAYTDSPDLHPNLILSGLQVMFWLFFHPSAWKEYVLRMTGGKFGAEITLVELVRTHQNSHKFRQNLLQFACWCMLFPAISVTVFLLFRGTSLSYATGAGFFLVTAALVFFLLSGIGINIATACIGALLSTIAYGWAGSLGMRGDLSGALALSMMGSVALTIAGSRRKYSYSRQTIGVIIGFALGLAVTAIIRLSGTRIELTQMLAEFLSELELGNVYGGMRVGAAYALSFVVPYLITQFFAGPRLGVVVGAFVCGIWQLYFSRLAPQDAPGLLLFSGILAIAGGLTLHLWRPIVLYLLFLLYNRMLLVMDLGRAVGRPPLLRYHAAFWDEHQRLPWKDLDKHLLLVLERDPAEGQLALEYLAKSRFQRWAAQSAQIELDARQLERCADISAIGRAYHSLTAGELEGPASAMLRSFSRVSQDVEAALRQETTYNQRLALSAVEERIDRLLRELTSSSEKYALRFRPVAQQWRQIVGERVRSLAAEVEARQEIDSPYISGVPLTTQQEIFVGRSDISARIEQLLLDKRRPPLLLYGQRRMGKTSLLNNLGRLLPSTVVPLFVDLQGPVSLSSDHAGMLYYMARNITDSARQHRNLQLPHIARERLERDPFGIFDEWLAEVEQALGEANGLLMLDEFEALDDAIASGRFHEASVLGMLRHIIQHRPRFKILLAGSHTLNEFSRWSSYLINVQVIQIGYLQQTEALQLIERPVKDFALRYTPEASAHILALTRGHPFLIQLLCAEVVVLKNTQDPAIRRLVDLADVEAAVPDALTSGHMFFVDIAGNTVDSRGLALLKVIAHHGQGAVVSEAQLGLEEPEQHQPTLHLLLERDLLERAEGGYRFQVELIRRWFAQ